jgi:hypothetical protein
MSLVSLEIQDFLERFRFLHDHINENEGEEVSSVEEGIVDTSLLLRAPKMREVILHSNVKSCYYFPIQVERLLVLDQDGELLATIGGAEYKEVDNSANKAAATLPWKWFVPTWRYVKIPNPATVREALEILQRQKNLDRVGFVLSFMLPWGDERNGDLVLYQPFKQFTLADLLEHSAEIDAVRRQVLEERSHA